MALIQRHCSRLSYNTEITVTLTFQYLVFLNILREVSRGNFKRTRALTYWKSQIIMCRFIFNVSMQLNCRTLGKFCDVYMHDSVL